MPRLSWLMDQSGDPPKTQSALLEAVQNESTVAGETTCSNPRSFVLAYRIPWWKATPCSSACGFFLKLDVGLPNGKS